MLRASRKESVLFLMEIDKLLNEGSLLLVNESPITFHQLKSDLGNLPTLTKIKTFV